MTSLARRLTGSFGDGGIPRAPISLPKLISAFANGTIPFVFHDMTRELGISTYRIPYPAASGVYVVSDPKLVREILLDPTTIKPYSMHKMLDQVFAGKNVFTAQDDDPRWAQARDSILPALEGIRERIQAVAIKLAEEFLATRAEPLSRSGGAFDPRREFAILFMREVIESAFEYDGTFEEIAAVFDNWEAARVEFFIRRVKNPVRGPLSFLIPSAKAGARANRDVHAFARKILTTYRESSAKSDETTVIKAMIDSPHYASDDDIVADIVTLFGGPQSAGFHVAFVLHDLARHPEVRNRLRTELQAMYDAGRELSTSPYLARILRETNRLHPVNAISSIRQIGRDYPLADGKLIPTGSIVYTAQYVLNRDAGLYPDPESYDPDRWASPVLPELTDASMPFSIGKRDCLGQVLAHVGWANIIPRLTIGHDYEIATEPRYQFGYFLEPAGIELSVKEASMT